jgi:hypothetical protein
MSTDGLNLQLKIGIFQIGFQKSKLWCLKMHNKRVQKSWEKKWKKKNEQILNQKEVGMCVYVCVYVICVYVYVYSSKKSHTKSQVHVKYYEVNHKLYIIYTSNVSMH